MSYLIIRKRSNSVTVTFQKATTAHIADIVKFATILDTKNLVFRSSSVVEQSTVNRLVVGSNPTCGAQDFFLWITKTTDDHRSSVVLYNNYPYEPFSITSLSSSKLTVCFSSLRSSRSCDALVPSGRSRVPVSSNRMILSILALIDSNCFV